METSNRNSARFFVIVLLIGLAIATGIAILLYSDNQELKNQVVKRDALIKQNVVNDSLFSNRKTKSDSIIEKYIDECNILVNNKKVSTEELLDFLNSQVDEIKKLESEKSILSDSLRIYKSYVSLSKSNLNVNYKTEKKENSLVSTIILPTDSLQIYRKLYKLMQEDYGIYYKIRSDDKSTYYSKSYSKLDSALFVYKYYQYTLSGDSLGNISIILPDKKDLKKKKK
jgi:hypothetical protein